MDDRTPAPMSFAVSKMKFPVVTEAHKIDGNYGVSVPWEDLPERLAEIMGEQVLKAKGSRWGLVTLRSKSRPRTYGMAEDNSDMVAFRQRLDATNMRLEAGLIHQPGEVFVTFWEKTKGPNYGEIGVSLEAIRIDPSKIVLPGFEQIPTWRAN